MLRFLLVPSFYMQNVMGCAGVRIMWAIGRGLAENGHIVNMVFPKTAPEGTKGRKVWKVTAEKFLESVPAGRAKDVWVDMVDYKFDNCVVPGLVELLQQTQCSFPYDVIIDFSRTRSLFFRRIMAEAYGGGAYDVWTPIVNLIDDLNVKGKSHYKNEDVTLLNVFGAIGDWACYTTPREQMLFKKEAQTIVQPAVLQRIMKRGTVVGIPVDLSRAEKVLTKRERLVWNKPHVTVMYGGQFSGKKNVDEMLRQVEKVFRSGLPVRMKITTMGTPDERTQAWEEQYKDFLTIHYEVYTEQFIEHLADADVFFCFSDDEAAGLSFVEMLASGLVGIYRMRPWLQERVGDRYPWAANSFDECGAMLAQIVRNFPKAREEFFAGGWSSKEINQYNYKVVGARIADVCEKLFAERTKVTKGWVYDLAKQVKLFEHRKIGFDDVCGRLKAGSKKGLEFGFKRMVHGHHVRRLMLDNGFVDVGDVDSVVFEKRRE